MRQYDPSPHDRSLLILVGSPRRDGNSAVLADAVREGAVAAGLGARVRFLDDYLGGFLRDMRVSSLPPMGDRYEELFLDEFLPAGGVVFCTPVYWYSMSAQTKAFLDRSFEYYAEGHPRHADVQAGMQRKRIGLAVVSEENYPGVILGIVHQLQEYARYTHSSFIGVVHGVGNRRGEVAHDPRRPVAQARALGRELFDRGYSDYRMDTPRATRVWSIDD